MAKKRIDGRGGYRENAPKPTWNYGKTTTMRVPIALKDELLKIAREMDKGGNPNNPPSLQGVRAVLTQYRNLLDEKPSKGKATTRKDTARWENVEKLVSELEGVLQKYDL